MASALRTGFTLASFLVLVQLASAVATGASRPSFERRLDLGECTSLADSFLQECLLKISPSANPLLKLRAKQSCESRRQARVFRCGQEQEALAQLAVPERRLARYCKQTNEVLSTNCDYYIYHNYVPNPEVPYCKSLQDKLKELCPSGALKLNTNADLWWEGLANNPALSNKENDVAFCVYMKLTAPTWVSGEPVFKLCTEAVEKGKFIYRRLGTQECQVSADTFYEECLLKISSKANPLLKLRSQQSCDSRRKARLFKCGQEQAAASGPESSVFDRRLMKSAHNLGWCQFKAMAARAWCQSKAKIGNLGSKASASLAGQKCDYNFSLATSQCPKRRLAANSTCLDASLRWFKSCQLRSNSLPEETEDNQVAKASALRYCESRFNESNVLCRFPLSGSKKMDAMRLVTGPRMTAN